MAAHASWRTQIGAALGGLLVVLGSVDMARAITVQIGAAKDNTILQNNPNNTAGGQTQFYSGTNTAVSPRRGLIEFDIASKVPSGATITSVDLTLVLSMVAGSGMGGGGGSPTIGLHPLSKEWGEGTVSSGSGQGGAAAPGDATWNAAAFNVTNWTTAGGDFSTASASLTIVGTTIGTSYTWLSTSALVSDVQGWLNDSGTNHGWALVDTNESTAQSLRAFNSREASSALQPVLSVSYVIPEPSTFALLTIGCGLLLLVRRTRRSQPS